MTKQSNKNFSITKHTWLTLKKRLNQIDQASKELRRFYGDWTKDLIKGLEDELERLRPRIKRYFG